MENEKQQKNIKQPEQQSNVVETNQPVAAPAQMTSNDYGSQPQSTGSIPTKSQDGNMTKETLATVSMIVGIVCLVLAFFLSIFVLIPAIVGLVLGIVSKTKKGTKAAGIILNSAAIVVAIIMTIVLSNFGEKMSEVVKEAYHTTSSNPIAGKYDCADADSRKGEYVVTLHLNDDNTFLYGPYGELSDDNHAKGTYTYEKEDKTNYAGNYNYYMVTMTGEKEDYVINGSQASHGFNDQMEFALTTDGGEKQGTILFYSSNNTYLCREQ